MYCAVTGLFKTVSFPSVIVTESLVQVTVVAGPPVEVQVRGVLPSSILVNSIVSDSVISPTKIIMLLYYTIIYLSLDYTDLHYHRVQHTHDL